MKSRLCKFITVSITGKTDNEKVLKLFYILAFGMIENPLEERKNARYVYDFLR